MTHRSFCWVFKAFLGGLCKTVNLYPEERPLTIDEILKLYQSDSLSVREDISLYLNCSLQWTLNLANQMWLLSSESVRHETTLSNLSLHCPFESLISCAYLRAAIWCSLCSPGFVNPYRSSLTFMFVKEKLTSCIISIPSLLLFDLQFVNDLVLLSLKSYPFPSLSPDLI